MAKRITLREFQEGLVRRLTSAARGESSRALLGVLSGNDYWLMNLSDAGEIVPLPQHTEVPLTKKWFAGIANIRGTLYSVVDFSAFRGGEPTLRNSDARLLLIGARHGINSALLVSRALGLKNPESLEAIPPTDGQSADELHPWVGECYRDKQDISWHMLCIKPLLGFAEFIDIGI